MKHANCRNHQWWTIAAIVPMLGTTIARADADAAFSAEVNSDVVATESLENSDAWQDTDAYFFAPGAPRAPVAGGDPQLAHGRHYGPPAAAPGGASAGWACAPCNGRHPKRMAMGEGRMDPDPAVIERSKQLRGKVLRQRAGLSDETAKKVEEVLDRYEVRLQEQTRAQRTNMKAIRQLVRDDSNDMNAYKTAITAVQAAKDETHKIRREQAQSMEKILTPKEYAKVTLALKEMQEQARAALAEQRAYPPPNGNFGPPPGANHGPGPYGGPMEEGGDF